MTPNNGQQVTNMIGDWAKKTCSIISSAQGGCAACERNGDIAIFPIRYSAAYKEMSYDFYLPSEEVRKFTDIEYSSGGLVGYTYRKLREGFLYVYDDHPVMPLWHCFMVSERGELTEFPIDKKVSIEDIQNLKCSVGACAAWSSLISLRDSKISRDVYFVYVEMPYSKKYLNELEKNKDKRNKVMQSICIGNTEECQEVVDLKSIEFFVPEYNKSAISRSILTGQIHPGRFSTSVYEENKDTFENMYSYATRSKDCSARLSFALIIHDYVGIIEQLNYLRYEPYKKFHEDMLPGNEGDEKDDKKSPGKVLNESNYKWYLAVSQLKKVMDSMPVRGGNIEEKFVATFDLLDMPAGDSLYHRESKRVFTEAKDKGMTYEQVKSVIQEKQAIMIKYSGLMENKKRELEAATSSNEIDVVNERYKKFSDEGLYDRTAVRAWMRLKAHYETSWKRLHDVEENNRRNATEDFNSCYNNEAFSNIEKLVQSYNCRIDINVQDSDGLYSKWVKKYICKSIAAFDDGDFWHGLRRSQVILDMLFHGILGEESAKLWEWLENSEEGHELTALCYSGGDNKIYSLVKDIYSTEFSNSKLSVQEVESNSKDFWDKIKDLTEKFGDVWDAHKKQNYKTLWFDTEMKDYLKSVKSFNFLKGSSNSALFMKKVAPMVRNGDAVLIDFRKENRQMALDKLGRQLDQIDPEFKGKVGSKIKYFSIEVSGNEVHAISKKMTDAALGKSSQIINRASQKFKSSAATGGNFSSTKKFTGPKMKLYFAASEENAKKIMSTWNEAIRKRTNAVDALVQACNDTVEDGKIRSQGKIKGKYMVRATGFLGMWSVKGSLEKFVKEQNFDNFWSLASDSLSLMQNACQHMELRVARKSIKTTPSRIQVKPNGVLAASKWSIAEKTLGHVVAIMAIYDFMKGMAEVDEMRAKGERSSFIMNKTMEVTLTFASALIVGIIVTSVIGGVIVALCGLIFLQFFKKEHYAPECIVNWTRRSKFGVDGDTAPGLKFKSMQEEQESIGMIWKGITINLNVESKVISTTQVSDVVSVETLMEKTINYKISCPMDSELVFRVVRKIESGDSEGYWIHLSNIEDGVIVYPMRSDSDVTEVSELDLSGRHLELENKELSVKDYYGRNEKINIANKVIMNNVSVVLLPAIKYIKEKDIIKSVDINFSEKIFKKRGDKENELELEVDIWSEEENYKDSYRTKIYFDNTRVV